MKINTVGRQAEQTLKRSCKAQDLKKKKKRVKNEEMALAEKLQRAGRGSEVWKCSGKVYTKIPAQIMIKIKMWA